MRCIVLTGSGGAFSGGGDVKAMAASGDGTVGDDTIDGAIHRQRINQQATSGKLFTMPKPTIASLPGAAAGGGLALALACDLRIMASSAFMTTAFARVGFSGDYGGSYFLTQLVGSAKARELYYLSDRVGAEEALRLGLTNWVCADDELGATTRAVATRLAAGPTVAYRYMKENLNRAMTGDLTTVSTSRSRTTSTADRPRTTARRPRRSSPSASRSSTAAEPAGTRSRDPPSWRALRPQAFPPQSVAGDLCQR